MQGGALPMTTLGPAIDALIAASPVPSGSPAPAASPSASTAP
jgi:hypothetical protein